MFSIGKLQTLELGAVKHNRNTICLCHGVVEEREGSVISLLYEGDFLQQEIKIPVIWWQRGAEVRQSGAAGRTSRHPGALRWWVVGLVPFQRPVLLVPSRPAAGQRRGRAVCSALPAAARVSAGIAIKSHL